MLMGLECKLCAKVRAACPCVRMRACNTLLATTSALGNPRRNSLRISTQQ